MKSAIILLLFLANCALSTVSAQGIDFQSDTVAWSVILEKAKTENKIIFVDAYTSWCGPCKRMAKDIFPQKAVGDVYNAAFINVKMDMERGEGPAVAMRYGVKAYPTYMFINAQGELVHRGLGSMPLDKFIAVGKTAANPETQFFALKKKYENGEKSAEFLKNFTFSCSDAQEDALADEAANAYLKSQKDLSTDDNVAFVYRFAKKIDSDAFQYWLNNRGIFEKKFGKLQADADLDERLVTAIGKPFFNGPKKGVDMEKAREAALKNIPIDAERILSLLVLQNCEMKGDVAGILTQASNHLEKFPSSNPNQLNDFAWFFYENTSGKESLEKALTWSLKSIELSENSYPFHDTAAAIYFKLKDKIKAKEYAEKALKLGKEKKEDTAETENLLKKIDAM